MYLLFGSWVWTDKEFQAEIIFPENNFAERNGWEFVEKVVDLIPQIRVYLVSEYHVRPAYKGADKNITI